MEIHFLIILKYETAEQPGVGWVGKKTMAFFVNNGQYGPNLYLFSPNCFRIYPSKLMILNTYCK